MLKKMFLLLVVIFIGFNQIGCSKKEKTVNRLEINGFKTELAQQVEKLIKKSDGIYPSYYGGMYISNDSKNLVIQVVKENIPNQSNTEEYDIYSEMLNIDKSIIVEYVDNSYNDLENVFNQIVEYINNNSEYDNYTGSYIDVYSNKVLVFLKVNSKKRREEFKKLVIDSDLITFIEKKENDNNLTTTISNKEM